MTWYVEGGIKGYVTGGGPKHMSRYSHDRASYGIINGEKRREPGGAT